MLPSAPPGIEPDIFPKIKALFRQLGYYEVSVAKEDRTYGVPATEIPNVLADIVYEDQPTREESKPPIKETEVFLEYDSDTEQEEGAKSSKGCHRVKVTGARKKRTRRIVKLGSPIEMITASYAYPVEPCADPLTFKSSPYSPDAVESMPGSPHHSKPPLDLFSFFTQVIHCISRYIAHYLPFPFSLLQSATSLYLGTDTEYKTDANIDVEPEDSKGQKVPEKVIRVLAFAAGEEDEETGCAEPLEMQARYKRVNEIMRESGYRVEEEMYRKQIRKALKKLKE